MNKETLEAIKEVYEMIHQMKIYIDVLQKRIALLEKSNG
jgi:hypothetical protein